MILQDGQPLARAWRVCLAIAGGLLLLAGCGGGVDSPPIAAVSGTVNYNGQPVKSGRILFADDERGRQFSGKIASGRYELRSQYGAGIPLGSYKVRIVPAGPAIEPDPTASPEPVDAPDIPDRYREFGSSELTAEVTAAGGPYDFEMQAE